MQRETTPILTGRCHCGSITYQASGPILHQGTCTCRPCQRATATLASPNIGVPPEHFEITSGKIAQYRADSDVACDSGAWHFCSTCGSQLYWTNASGTELAIFVGTLDDTSVFQPET